MKTWPLFSASSGAAYPTAGHHSRASSQVSGPLHQSILMLRLRAGIQTRSISSKVRRITTVLLCRVFFFVVVVVLLMMSSTQVAECGRSVAILQREAIRKN